MNSIAPIRELPEIEASFLRYPVAVRSKRTLIRWASELADVVTKSALQRNSPSLYHDLKTVLMYAFEAATSKSSENTIQQLEEALARASAFIVLSNRL